MIGERMADKELVAKHHFSFNNKYMGSDSINIITTYFGDGTKNTQFILQSEWNKAIFEIQDGQITSEKLRTLADELDLVEINCGRKRQQCQ
jgi:hypothetical protein